MAFDLTSISRGKRIRAPRIVLLGIEKIGKSTFASQSPNPAVIPIIGEEGIDDLDVFKWDNPVPSSYMDVLQCIETLRTGEHEFLTVVLDSVSALEPLIWQATCQRNSNAGSIEKVGGGYGKGYIESLTEWDMLLRGLDALRAERNMSSIIVGHVKIRRFDDPSGPSYDQYQLDINEKAANKLFRWADSILFCNTKVAVRKEETGFNREIGKATDIGGGQRFLYTQKRPAHPGGGRGIYGRLPYELPLSYAVFQQAVADAMQQEA